jgi:hypothetical protein
VPPVSAPVTKPFAALDPVNVVVAVGESSVGNEGTGGTVYNPGETTARIGMPGILVPDAPAHHDFSLGESSSCISSCKKFRRSNDSLFAFSRLQRLRVRRRAAQAIIAAIAAKTTTPMLVNTPMTAVRFEKKPVSARLLLWVCADGLLTSAVTVIKELPWEVRNVVVRKSGGSVEVLSAADVLVDVGELDWERLVTLPDETWVLVEMRVVVVGSGVIVIVTGGPVTVSVLGGVTVGLGTC